jgi:spore coat polysaccharide biosynthesis protein SpsF
MNRRLVAAIACRNQGSRLYGKPLQNLDVEKGIRILDNIIDCIRSVSCVNEIVLGIADGIENDVFKRIATEKHLRCITGDENDVLQRLIACGQLAEATDVFRVTSESPFLYYEPVEKAWQDHISNDMDATFYDEGIDGTGFEIISLQSLELSHKKGNSRHRSELCTLYIRENKDDFKIQKIVAPAWLKRKDLRLTVDNPEDLAVCRNIYAAFKDEAPCLSIEKIVAYFDKNPELKQMIAPFTEAGYATMNL